MSSPPPDLVVLGCGFVGRAVAERALDAGRQVCVTTRDPARRRELAELLSGVRVSTPERAVGELAGRDLVVTYPPDPESDLRFVDAARAARAVAYVSSTAVYGDTAGVIDDSTPPAPSTPRGRARLAAEQRWRSIGAVVLRAPGIYGRERGVHVRLRAGSYRLPGDGERHVSRIHVDDLADVCLAALTRGEPGAAHAVGDLEPTTHRVLVQYLCERLDLPMPESVPLAQVHETLRGDRQVDPRPALQALAVSLRHPDYHQYLD